MAELTFRPLDEAELQAYAAWFEDAELRRRIETPTARWFEYVTRTPGIYAWMVYDGEAPVGNVQLDTDAERHGYVGLVVNPPLHHRGYGARILRALLQRPEVTGLDRLEATIEPDNTAALRCCQRGGFVQTGSEPDEEGFLHFACAPAPAQQPN